MFWGSGFFLSAGLLKSFKQIFILKNLVGLAMAQFWWQSDSFVDSG